jgi:hypothetical protein
VLALTMGGIYLIHPTEATLVLAVASAIPLVWLAADRDGPPGPSPPGPWSGP